MHREWVGVEALAALPGSVGEVVTRGGAAYHQGVADTVSSVRTWDRESDQQRTFAAADCEFTAGSSRFARQPQLEIRDVSFLLRQGDLSLPITGESLADARGIEPGGRASLSAVRDVALARAATPARS